MGTYSGTTTVMVNTHPLYDPDMRFIITQENEKKCQAKLDENGNKIARIAVDLASIRELPDVRAPKLIKQEIGRGLESLFKTRWQDEF